jgi:methylthioribulose-1-phosphate dehydratase
MLSMHDPTSDDLATELAETVRFLAQKGWAPGTGGNFSAVRSQAPLRLLITPSGVDKSQLRAQELLEIDANGAVLTGSSRASAETQLHLAIVTQRSVGAVLHTHSIWNTLLSRHFAREETLHIEGYEMLKGLQGVTTHLHRETVPLLENSQDMAALSGKVAAALDRYPACHGILLQGHGLYTWGDTLAEARRHVEIFEFLFEVVARERWRDTR